MPPCCSIGFCAACPASAYDDVIESMTLCAFSCPISAQLPLAYVHIIHSNRVQGMPRTLIVLDDIAQVIAAAVVGLAHAHGIVSEVHIAVVALRIMLAHVV